MLPHLTQNGDVKEAIDKDLPFECSLSKLRLFQGMVLKSNGVRALCNNTALQELFIEADQNNALFEALGEILKHSKQLHRVHINGQGTNLTVAGAKAFVEGLAHNKTLKRLFLGNLNHASEFWSEVCGNLDKSTSLNELDLNNVNLLASFYKLLSAGLLRHQTLHTIRFYWSNINTHALAELLKNTKHIATVYLYCCKFDDLTVLSHAIELSPVLTSLTVDCRMNDSLPLINAVKQHKTLTTLHLTSIFRGTNLDYFVPLMQALQSNTTLTTLGLRSNGISDNQQLAAIRDMLKANKSITHLDLMYCTSGEVYTRVAEALAVNTTLQKLELSCFYHHNITDEQCRSIADALKINSSLTDLSIMLGTPGTNALCEALTTNRSVSSLQIDVLYLKDSFNALCTMLTKNKSLTSLNLDYRDFMNGHKLLGDALLVNKLVKKLTLTCSPVAFEHLCRALKKLPQLATLHLKFLVTQGAIDEKLKSHALGLLKAVLKKNRVITTATIDLDPYANNFESERLVEIEIANNRQIQSTIQGDAAVLLQNIVRSSGALELFPLEIWLAIFCQVTFPGVKFSEVVNRIVKKRSLV